MENNFKDSDQFVLSYELLQLMEWLLESEPEALKKLIKKSLKNGLGAKLKKEKNNSIIAHQAQDGIINFLTLFEILLSESMGEESVDNIMQKALIPAIDQVDIKNCDSATVKSSVSIVTSKLERNPKENAQELFLKELLKRWKPEKNKRTIN